MTTRHETSRRAMLQGALAMGAIAGGAFTRAMAANQITIGPNTVNRQWLLASHAEDAISPANFAYRETPLGDAAMLKPGEVIVRNIVFSPLPSQRIRMHADTGHT